MQNPQQQQMAYQQFLAYQQQQQQLAMMAAASNQQRRSSNVALNPQQQMAMAAAQMQQMQQQQQQQQQQHVQLPPKHSPAAIYQEFMRLAMNEDWYLDGGHRNRILLALRSGLPNEIDWAFNKLVLLSYMAPDHFVLSMIPGVVETLLEHAHPFFRFMNNFILPNLSDPNAVVPQSDQAIMDSLFLSDNILSDDITERTLQIFHILRNFSFVDANIPILNSHVEVLRLVSYGLRAIGFAKSTEIRSYALDTLENLSVLVKIRDSQDLVFKELKHMLFEPDRAVIIGSLRTLSKLVHLEQNEKVFSEVDPKIIQRLLQLLFVWDEELVAAAMDFLYHYTSLYGNVPAKIANSLPCNFVPILLKFLEWRQKSRMNQNAQNENNTEVSQKQCSEWLLSNYSADNNLTTSISQKILYQDYIAFCVSENNNAHSLPLPLNNFINAIQTAFPDSTMDLENSNVIIKGITKQNGSEENGEVDVEKASNDEEEEEEPDEEEMEVDDDNDEDYVEEEADEGNQKNIRSQNNAQSSQESLQSPNTNAQPSQLPQTMSRGRSSAASITNNPAQQAPQQPQQNNDNISSIPLTCALVLRNLAQSKANRSLFLPYESDLVSYTTLRHIHESVSKVLANILHELAKSED